jgi:diguanylate cyclase (GGDEF)-like protein
MPLFKRSVPGSDMEHVAFLTIGVGILGVLAGVGAVLLWIRERAARMAQEHDRASQRELLETLQATRSETEGGELLERHARRAVRGATASYLGPDQPCAAARLGREYRRRPDAERLLACERCSSCDTPTTCLPAVAGGETIGTLLVEHLTDLDERELVTLRDAVAGSAPALAHLRNLAAAESRAATDALTGLPNSRSLRDALKRMVAQAGRSVSPLSVVLLDLDRFRRINDTFGHERGDDALAAIGELLRESVRASDYVGRFGGEEFLIVLPETDRDGAAVLAEKVRLAISQTTVAGVDRPLTASFGVASLPADGGDGDSVVRLADRALIAAQAAGGNCVETAGLSIAPAPDAD